MHANKKLGSPVLDSGKVTSWLEVNTGQTWGGHKVTWDIPRVGGGGAALALHCERSRPRHPVGFIRGRGRQRSADKDTRGWGGRGGGRPQDRGTVRSGSNGEEGLQTRESRQ